MCPLERWWVSSAKRWSKAYLETMTRAHWERRQPREDASVQERMMWYVTTLLPEELYYADEIRNGIEFHDCHTLVLLVGHSPEPLLQAIGVFQPTRLVLLLNTSYGDQTGAQRGAEMIEWIRQWLNPLLPKPLASSSIETCEVDDTPNAVFHALCENALPDQLVGRSVIVDITGAKKSMTAGAFLFAAYADIPISYVDFDAYDETYRRPFGFNCRIGTLTNPYDAFRLREWERLHRLYDNYHFRAAAGVLMGILGEPKTPLVRSTDCGDTVSSLSRPEYVEAAQKLLGILHCYEAWDDGDYAGAKQRVADLQHLPGFEPPTAVTLLGDDWPTADGTHGAMQAAEQLLSLHNRFVQGAGTIFRSNRMLLTYARDELQKVARLVDKNEDNRSALLRAAGLDELLLKARLMRLWDRDWLNLTDRFEGRVGSCLRIEQALQSELHAVLLRHQGTDHMRRALQRAGITTAYVRLDVGGDSYRARPSPLAPTLTAYDRQAGLDGEVLTKLRNQAIHMYLYVTQPIAQAAVEIARANLDEFERIWSSLSDDSIPFVSQQTEHMSWADLCNTCGLDFLPLGIHTETGNPQRTT